jgi:ammonia channel protein AmtB
MSLFLTKIGKQIFKNRIKPFVIIELLLFIPYVIVGYYAVKGQSTNNDYYGLSQTILAGFWLVMGIEYFFLKRRLVSFFYFIFTLAFIFLSLDSFKLIN